MSIEQSLERIATALETLVAQSQKEPITDPVPAQAAEATPTVRRRRSTAPAASSPASQPEPTTSSTATDTTAAGGGEWDEEPAKEEAPPPKKLTVEDVRAKFVELQSLVGKKDPVIAILQKLTGGATIGGLKESQFAEAIAAADFAIRQFKKG